MKKEIIITILVITVLIIFTIFTNTLIRYFKIKNLETKPENIEDEIVESKINNTIIPVDENSSIRIIEEYDETMFKGHKSLVFFWASWCSHCRAEYDVVKTVIKDYQNQGYKIYVVSHDYETEELADFMSKNDFDYEVWFDQQRVIRAHFDPEASSVPLTYIIDENAKLIDSHNGEITLEKLNELIDKNM